MSAEKAKMTKEVIEENGFDFSGPALGGLRSSIEADYENYPEYKEIRGNFYERYLETLKMRREQLLDGTYPHQTLEDAMESYRRDYQAISDMTYSYRMLYELAKAEDEKIATEANILLSELNSMPISEFREEEAALEAQTRKLRKDLEEAREAAKEFKLAPITIDIEDSSKETKQLEEAEPELAQELRTAAVATFEDSLDTIENRLDLIDKAKDLFNRIPMTETNLVMQGLRRTVDTLATLKGDRTPGELLNDLTTYQVTNTLANLRALKTGLKTAISELKEIRLIDAAKIRLDMRSAAERLLNRLTLDHLRPFIQKQFEKHFNAALEVEDKLAEVKKAKEDGIEMDAKFDFQHTMAYGVLHAYTKLVGKDSVILARDHFNKEVLRYYTNEGAPKSDVKLLAGDIKEEALNAAERWKLVMNKAKYFAAEAKEEYLVNQTLKAIDQPIEEIKYDENGKATELVLFNKKTIDLTDKDVEIVNYDDGDLAYIAVQEKDETKYYVPAGEEIAIDPLAANLTMSRISMVTDMARLQLENIEKEISNLEDKFDNIQHKSQTAFDGMKYISQNVLPSTQEIEVNTKYVDTEKNKVYKEGMKPASPEWIMHEIMGQTRDAYKNEIATLSNYSMCEVSGKWFENKQLLEENTAEMDNINNRIADLTEKKAALEAKIAFFEEKFDFLKEAPKASIGFDDLDVNYDDIEEGYENSSLDTPESEEDFINMDDISDRKDEEVLTDEDLEFFDE